MIFHTTALSAQGWGMALAVASSILLLDEAKKLILKLRFFRTICGRVTGNLSVEHELPTASVVRSSRATPARRRGQLCTEDFCA